LFIDNLQKKCLFTSGGQQPQKPGPKTNSSMYADQNHISGGNGVQNNQNHLVNNTFERMSPPSNPPSRQDMYGGGGVTERPLNGNNQTPSKLNGIFPKQRYFIF
jgi:hypothetical protein